MKIEIDTPSPADVECRRTIKELVREHNRQVELIESAEAAVARYDQLTDRLIEQVLTQGRALRDAQAENARLRKALADICDMAAIGLMPEAAKDSFLRKIEADARAALGAKDR